MTVFPSVARRAGVAFRADPRSTILKIGYALILILRAFDSSILGILIVNTPSRY